MFFRWVFLVYEKALIWAKKREQTKYMHSAASENTGEAGSIL